MNTGMDDVANLGWKLAALVQNWGGPGLLTSYERERRPIAIRNTNAAQSMARHIGDIPIAACLLEESPTGACARKETGAALGLLTEEFSSLGIQLGARYQDSNINVYDAGAPPADSPHQYIPSSVPGGRAPHFWIEPNVISLYDILGPGFSLLCLGSAERTQSFREAAERRGVPLKILSIAVPEARDLYGVDYALLRPDQYIAWRGNEIPQNCDALVAAVAGWR